MGQPPMKNDVSSPMAVFCTVLLFTISIGSLLLLISTMTAVKSNENVIEVKWNYDLAQKVRGCSYQAPYALQDPENLQAERNLAKQIKDLNLRARLDKDTMDRLYAAGHTTPITDGTFAEKLALNLFYPDPSRFEGVEEYFNLTGRNQTIAKFLFLSRPMKIDKDEIWFVTDDGPTSNDITIGGCRFGDKACHTMGMSFVKNDLIIVEQYTSQFQQIKFSRVFYISSEVLIKKIQFKQRAH